MNMCVRANLRLIGGESQGYVLVGLSAQPERDAQAAAVGGFHEAGRYGAKETAPCRWVAALGVLQAELSISTTGPRDVYLLEVVWVNKSSVTFYLLVIIDTYVTTWLNGCTIEGEATHGLV